MIASVPVEIIDLLAPSGLHAILLGIAVWWLSRSNTELVRELNRERSERLDGMEQHIQRCEKHIEDCDRDRKELREQIFRLMHQ